MLVVDPMKRMTIPEIRQHPWFQARLPRYLAVPPPDTTQQAKKVGKLFECMTKSWSMINDSLILFLLKLVLVAFSFCEKENSVDFAASCFGIYDMEPNSFK